MSISQTNDKIGDLLKRFALCEPDSLPRNFEGAFDYSYFPWEGDAELNSLAGLILSARVDNPQDNAPIFLLKASGCGKTKIACSLNSVKGICLIPIRLDFSLRRSKTVL
jgi:hypothetical protein